MRTLSIILFLLAFSYSPVSSAIIKSGDVLEIVVQAHPEFSGRFSVSETGAIDYPFFADQSIVNITTSELMNDLTLRLAKHIDNPLVIITTVEKPEITVSVLGHVKIPGPVKTYAGATLQEVLQLAEGPLPLADLSKVKIVHKNVNNEAAEFFDLKAFLLSGDVTNMPRLKADDMVILLASKGSRKVKVIGAVNKPGFFDLEEDMNVFECIYLAGGPAERADMSHVRRIFDHDGKAMEDVLNIQGYIDKGDMNNIPRVTEGDVIIVYARWYDWKTVLSVMNNILLFVVTLQAFGGVFK